MNVKFSIILTPFQSDKSISSTQQIQLLQTNPLSTQLIPYFLLKHDPQTMKADSARFRSRGSEKQLRQKY